jgi:hypothetical protein
VRRQRSPEAGQASETGDERREQRDRNAFDLGAELDRRSGERFGVRRPAEDRVQRER